MKSTLLIDLVLLLESVFYKWNDATFLTVSLKPYGSLYIGKCK